MSCNDLCQPSSPSLNFLLPTTIITKTPRTQRQSRNEVLLSLVDLIKSEWHNDRTIGVAKAGSVLALLEEGGKPLNRQGAEKVKGKCGEKEVAQSGREGDEFKAGVKGGHDLSGREEDETGARLEAEAEPLVLIDALHKGVALIVHVEVHNLKGGEA